MKRNTFLLVFVVFLLLFCIACTQQVDPLPVSTAAPIMLGGQSFSGTETSLSLVLQEDAFAVLDEFAALTTLDLTGSVCYDAIVSYQNTHPHVDVRYCVRIGETDVPHTATDLSVPSVPDPSLLAYLPALTTLTVTEPITADEAAALLAAAPSLALSYSVTFGDLCVSHLADKLDLSALPPDAHADALAAVAVLPNLKLVLLDPAEGPSRWSIAQAYAMTQLRPDLTVEYTASAFGVSFSLTDEVVSLNGIDLSGRVEELRALLPYLSNIGRLDMEYCGLPDEQMAQLRAEFPAPKIVWRVFVRNYSCRTDAVMIRFSNNSDKQRLYDEDVKPLIYCNELRFMDLGHDKITDAYFTAYMPDLEVCIMAVGDMADISALKNCKKLEYCELFTSNISDISALAACTELRHLNISRNNISDISPLYGLTKLERLWLSRNPIPQAQLDEIAARLPNCHIDFDAYNPTGTDWRFFGSINTDYTPRYALLRKQLLYDTPWITSYTAAQMPDFGA